MKQIFYTLSITFLILAATSCYEDKGNYDYREIGKVTISGLEDQYPVISFQDVLEIDPTVTSTDANDAFDYFWTLDRKPIRDEDEKKIGIDTIGKEKKLNYPVALKQGFYNLTLYITNRTTGLQIHKSVDLNVETPFSRGFYLLKEVGGNTELDLQVTETGVVMSNLLAGANGSVLEGKPVSLGVSFGYYYLNDASPDIQKGHSLNVITDKDLRLVRVEDMSTIFTYRNMYYGGAPANETPYYMFSYGFGVGYASSAGFYCNIQWGESSGGFGYPQTIDGGCKPNRHVVSDGLSAYFFDEKNGRFLNCDWNGVMNIYSDLGEKNEQKEFKPNGITHDLVYFGYCSTAGGGYALFSDATDNQKRYLYTMTLDPRKTHNPIEKVVTVDPATKLNRAEMFATNALDAKFIYSVVDNRIYAYNASENTEVELKPEGFADDEEITYISYRYWTQEDDVDFNFRYLAIGTHKDGKYKVYLYNLVGGETFGGPKYILKGEGKVVSMQYTSPKMDGGGVSAPYYSLSFE